jgi:hypothetical protein
VFSSFAPLRQGTLGLKEPVLNRQYMVTERLEQWRCQSGSSSCRLGKRGAHSLPSERWTRGATAQHCTAKGRQTGDGRVSKRKGVCPARSRSVGLFIVEHDDEIYTPPQLDFIHLQRHQVFRGLKVVAQFIAVCRRSKWSRHLTNSPFLALLATAGSKAAYKINSACSKAVC